MLRIGDFARLGRVTIKALRLYDEEGLLAPAHVDRATGYRCYEPDQLVRLSRILQLKDLGFPLAEIKTLLDDSRKLGPALDARRAALSSLIESERERLLRLDAFRDALDRDTLAPAVVVKPIAPILALTARRIVDASSDEITNLFETQETRAARARARAEESPFLLFHDGAAAEDRIDVEVCVPLEAHGADLPGARIVEGADAAGSVIYRGPYHQTPSLFTQLAEWIDANGGACAGPLREIYHRFGAAQVGYRLPRRFLADDPRDYVTELAAPMAPTRR
jgi:DNA-binding transcriptional MerR regulator